MPDDRIDSDSVRHFVWLSLECLAASERGDRETLDTFHHLATHGWGGPAMLTWLSMVGRWYPLEDTTDMTPHVMVSSDGSPPAADIWRTAEMTRMLMAAATHRDGDNLLALSAALHTMPGTVRSALVKSIAASAAYVATMPDVDVYSMYAYHLLCLCVSDRREFDVLFDLADFVLATRSGDSRSCDMIGRRIGGWEGERIAAALNLIGNTVAMVVGTTDLGSTVLVSDVTQGRDAMLSGVLEWRDETLDPGRDVNELEAVYAMRVLAAYQAGDPARVYQMIGSTPPEHMFVFRAVFGLMNLFGDSLRHLVGARVAGDGSEPGQPG